jgi:peptidoglycan glycosyltransferase
VLFGEAGVEAAFSARLRSRQDLAISDMLTAMFGGDLRPQSLRLSLDATLQRLAAEGLGDRLGAIVALDPKTGAVLAWVSRPGFDPTRIPDPAYASEVEADPTSPLVDRARSATYPPASTFKLIVAAEAIESALANADTPFPDLVGLELPGSTAILRNAGGDTCAGGGEVTLFTAVVRSCNIPFASLAMTLGSDAIRARAELFGFNSPIPFGLSTVASVFPDYSSDLAALAQAGIGERDVRATPLQMALVAAAIANDGEVMRPFLIEAVFDADGDPLDQQDPIALGRAISPSTADILTEMMVEVVERGTGTRTRIQGIRVAGKTGTSEAGTNPPAWFLGFAPADDPIIALAIVVEGGGVDGSGGTIAAPIARTLFEYWLLER